MGIIDVKGALKTDLVVLPLLGGVEEKETEVEEVEGDHHTRVTLQLLPQLPHRLRITDALHHEERLRRDATRTDLEGLPKQGGMLHIVQIEEIHRHIGIQEEFIQAGGMPEVHLLLGRREVETSLAGATHTNGIRRLYEVDQPVEQTLHGQRLLAATLGQIRQGKELLLLTELTIIIIRCMLTDDVGNQPIGKGGMHTKSVALGPAGKADQPTPQGEQPSGNSVHHRRFKALTAQTYRKKTG